MKKTKLYIIITKFDNSKKRNNKNLYSLLLGEGVKFK